MLSFCYNWCCHIELLFMIIHYYYVVIFQFVVHAAALWSALHGLVGVLDVQICNNMINIQAGYLKYKYKYKWLHKYNILLPPLKLETLFILFLNSFGAKRLLCLIMLNCFTGFGAKYGSGWIGDTTCGANKLFFWTNRFCILFKFVW